ncbi:MAG: hypothetical protein ACREVW_00345 [Burkholderiales bacterium]
MNPLAHQPWIYHRHRGGPVIDTLVPLIGRRAQRSAGDHRGKPVTP